MSITPSSDNSSDNSYSNNNNNNDNNNNNNNNNNNTGELGYDGLNETREIGLSYAKSVVYI